MAAAGKLLVFEGAEGVGKTTQIRAVCARLERLEVGMLAVREPGGTPLGDEIRRLLLDPDSKITPRAEALLFMASRAQLVEDVIRPALAAGTFVIADRFFLSTYAYQVYGRGLDEEEVRQANALATRGLVPDLTLLLDAPVALAGERTRARGAHDRIERAGEAFLTRVSHAFREFATPEWHLSHPECGLIVRVDATGSEADVSARILTVLSQRWPETFGAAVASNP